MQLHRLAIAAALAAAPLGLSAAVAATPAQVQPGMQVVDPSGGAVGTVVGVKGASVILKTTKHEVELPIASFTPNKGKLLFGMTAAQVDTAFEQAAAQANASVAVGATVYGTDGTPAGQIAEIGDSLVTITLTNGKQVKVPRNGISGTQKGAVLAWTTAKLNELAAQATSPDSATAQDASAQPATPQSGSDGN
jgi:preprotein translocase subunit YajC